MSNIEHSVHGQQKDIRETGGCGSESSDRRNGEELKKGGGGVSKGRVFSGGLAGWRQSTFIAITSDGERMAHYYYLNCTSPSTTARERKQQVTPHGPNKQAPLSSRQVSPGGSCQKDRCCFFCPFFVSLSLFLSLSLFVFSSSFSLASCSAPLSFTAIIENEKLKSGAVAAVSLRRTRTGKRWGRQLHKGESGREKRRSPFEKEAKKKRKKY